MVSIRIMVVGANYGSLRKFTHFNNTKTFYGSNQPKIIENVLCQLMWMNAHVTE